MIFGRCALCLTESHLCKSHIIPNALFRRLKRRQNTGSLIAFNDHPESKVIRSQESWWEHLLCEACEATIREYESYGLGLLRGGSNGDVTVHHAGVTFRNHAYAPFKLFLTSLVWRAAVSRQDVFANVHAPTEALEAARVSLLGKDPQSPSKFGARLARLVDETGVEGAFTNEDLRSFIVSPMPRQPRMIGYSVLFVVESFLIEYFIPFMPQRLRGSAGAHQDSRTLFVPFKCVFTVPELVALFGATHEKRRRGLVAFES